MKKGYYQGDPLKIAEDCSVLKPDLFPSVPRLYNKIYSKIKGTFSAATGCKSWLVNKAVNSKLANLAQSGSVQSGCWDAIVFKKTKAILGGNVRIMVTGSAPMELDVMNFLKICFCAPIVEAYGLTETTGATTIVNNRDIATGHVGGPIPCCKVRLRDIPDMGYLSTDTPYPRGEVCMKGPNIFAGYYKRPDKTYEAFDAEGWFLSGDVGQIFPNGTIKIIDRSKNLFKLS